MDCKFLSDGRKVSVVGKINSTEYIVQEIFITANGDEIPSGEKFTTKSLHDAPVESYADRDKKKKEQFRISLNSEIDSLHKEIKTLRAKRTANADMLKNSPTLQSLVGDQIDVFSKFMAGAIEYIVIDRWEISMPQKMEDALIKWENNYGERTYDSIRLLSVMGESKGQLDYRIHQYSDNSGGSDIVYPCVSYEEAVEKTKGFALARIEDGRFDKKDYEICKKLEIEFSADMIEKIKQILSKSINEGLVRIQDRIETAKKEEVCYKGELKALMKAI